MKIITILFALVFPLTAYSHSQIVITPDNPGLACSGAGSNRYINSIYDLKTDENEDELYISFSTHYYQKCIDDTPIPLKISDAYYFEFWHEGNPWPWKRYPFKDESFSLEDNKTLHIALIFDKKKKFKKTNKVTAQFSFTPNNSQLSGMFFGWRISLEKIDALHTKMTFR